MSEKFAQLNDEQRAKLTQFLDVREESGRTALFLAAEANRVKCADVLLRYKASTEAGNTNQVTPLGVACDQGHTAMILLLIENRARCDVKVNKKSLVECVASSVKSGAEKCEVVKALLSNGAIASTETLNSIRATLEPALHTTWDEAIVAAQKARAHNFTNAIGDAAPVPTDSVNAAPMDHISQFLGFDQELLPKDQ